MPLGTSVYFTIPLLVVSALATVGPMRKTRASASACWAAASLTVIWMIPVSLELCALAGTIVPIIPRSSARTSTNADHRLGALLMSCEILPLGSVLSLGTPRYGSSSHRALSDDRKELRAEVRELLLSYPADGPKLGRGARHLPRHRAQDGVAEHDVGRDVPLGRDLAAQGPQRREVVAVVLLVADCGGGAHPPGRNGRDRLAHHDRGALDERAPPGVGQGDDVVAGRGLRGPPLPREIGRGGGARPGADV